MGVDRSEHRSAHKGHGSLVRRKSSATRRPSTRRRRQSTLREETLIENASRTAAGNVDLDLTLGS